MAHPPRRPLPPSRLRTSEIEAIVQVLLEVPEATAADLATRTGLTHGVVHGAIARMCLRGAAYTLPTQDIPDSQPYVYRHSQGGARYALTGAGKTLAGMWGLTPRPRDTQGETTT